MSVKVFRVKRVEVFLYRGRRIYQYKVRRHSEILIHINRFPVTLIPFLNIVIQFLSLDNGRYTFKRGRGQR